MKSLDQLLTTVVGAVAGGALVFSLALGQPLARAAEPNSASEREAKSDETCDNGRTVQVSGAAAINVTPDRALLQLGVVSTASTPEEVEAENTATIRDIVEAVRQLGIANKDIATDYYVVRPIYVDYDTMQIKGYRIDNVVDHSERR